VWSALRFGRFTPGKDPVSVVQETGWAWGSCGRPGSPDRDSIAERPVRRESLVRPLQQYAKTPKGQSDRNTELTDSCRLRDYKVKRR